MDGRKNKKGVTPKGGNRHLKWTAIVLGILIILLVILLDQCSRTGKI